MTELERMLSGRLYDAGDEALQMRRGGTRRDHEDVAETGDAADVVRPDINGLLVLQSLDDELNLFF